MRDHLTLQDGPNREKVKSTRRLAESLRGVILVHEENLRSSQEQPIDLAACGAWNHRDASVEFAPIILSDLVARGDSPPIPGASADDGGGGGGLEDRDDSAKGAMSALMSRLDVGGDDDGAAREKAKISRRVSSVRGDGLKLNSSDVNATEIHMEVPDRVGLLSDVANCLRRENLNILHAHIYTTSDGMASNYFSVQCTDTKTKVPSGVLEKVRAALAARCHRDAVPGRSAIHGRLSRRISSTGLKDSETRDEISHRVMQHREEVTQQSPNHRHRVRKLAHLDLNALPPASSTMSASDRAVAEAALCELPAYASLTSRAARDEIIDELREVKWEPGEVAFDAKDPIPNVYIVTRGCLARDAFFSKSGQSNPRVLLRKGDLVGEVALNHAQTANAAITSVDENGVPVETTAFAINCETFKRIVRTRIHRQRQLCNNVLNIILTFRAVPTRKKELLLNALWSASVAMPPGTKLEFGTMSTALHVVLEGEVDVVPLHSEEKKKTLRGGDTFGNDFLMSPEMYARAESEKLLEDRLGHSYVCKTHAVLLLVTRGLLESLWGESFDSLLSFRCEKSRKEAKRNWKTGLSKVNASLSSRSSNEAHGGMYDTSDISSPRILKSPSPNSEISSDDGSEIGSPSSVAASTPGAGYGTKSRFSDTPSSFEGRLPPNVERYDPNADLMPETTKKKKKSLFSSLKKSLGAKIKGKKSKMPESGPEQSLHGAKLFKTNLDAGRSIGGSSHGGSQYTEYADDLDDSVRLGTNKMDLGGSVHGGSSFKTGSGKLNKVKSATNISGILTGGMSPARAKYSTYSAPPLSALGMSSEEYQALLSAETAEAAKDPFEGYTFVKQLGVGLTGSVYKCWKPNLSKAGVQDKEKPYVAVAVKIMDKAQILDINETEHVTRESSIMKAVCRHPFIITMSESFQTPSALCIVMEYAAVKDLFFMIHELGALSLFQTRAYFVQVVLALDHVHHKGFVYRDLKPENLLVRDDGYLRLTDFGFAKALKPGERAYTVCGTPDYLSPEALRHHGCNRAADFWAVGILLFEMMAGYPPFYGQTHSDLYRRITEGKHRTFPNTMSPHAQDLIRQLLRQEEGERIGMGAGGIQAIRSHPFFKGFSWSAVLEQRVDMTLPSKIEPDADLGPEDITEPCEVPCLTELYNLTDEEQKLFEGF